MARKKVRKVVVTTEQRGVFFGALESGKVGSAVVLTGVRNCIYWSADIGGFGGLASTGPSASCHIGAVVPRGECGPVTGIWDCTTEAIRAWEAAPCHKS